MKKFELKKSNATLFIGEAREIASLYKNLEKREIAYDIFADAPKFNMTKMYGLVLDYESNFRNIPNMQVVSSDTALRILLDEKQPLWVY